MLELQSVRYHPATTAQPVLRDINLRLAPGAPTLVAGRSGSGKTTLLTLVGEDLSDRGRQRLLGTA